MHNFGTFFLWALAACTLWNGSLATSLQSAHQSDSISLPQLQSLLNDVVQTQDRGKIVNQLQEVLNKIGAAKEKVPVLTKITVPYGFQLIGTRYFRIVHERVDWETAEKWCRDIGGYLASFRNEEEFNAIIPKLTGNYYWLGISDLDNEGHFVSVASHKPEIFFKWREGQPDGKNHVENCVYLKNGTMGDGICNHHAFFICQADNET